jgi:Domain of unknown function (DUF4399)
MTLIHMKRSHLLMAALAALVLGAGVAAQVAKTKSADGAKVYIIAPKNGAKVTSPFTVQFGVKGMGIAPAGVTNANTGHHHLLVDVAEMPDMNAPLPNNEHIRHFGGGQTEADLTLPPGKHTLQLLFADAAHIPHDKPLMSEKITVTVK